MEGIILVCLPFWKHEIEHVNNMVDVWQKYPDTLTTDAKELQFVMCFNTFSNHAIQYFSETFHLQEQIHDTHTTDSTSIGIL